MTQKGFGEVAKGNWAIEVELTKVPGTLGVVEVGISAFAKGFLGGEEVIAGRGEGVWGGLLVFVSLRD